MHKFISTSQIQMGRRAFAAASLLSVIYAASGCALRANAQPHRIVFVCQAGTAKSPIAREIFKERARERGVSVDVSSRGLVIEDHVSPELKAKLHRDGINTQAEPALVLSQADWSTADILINFNPLPSSVEHGDIRDWSDLPSVNNDYENARIILDRRIDDLITELIEINRKR
jgi:hypothetical protein